MKQFLLILLFLLTTSFSYAQEELCYSGTVRGLLVQLQNRYGCRFMYNNDKIDDKQNISIDLRGKDLKGVMESLSVMLNITFEIKNRHVLLVPARSRAIEPEANPANVPSRLESHASVSEETPKEVPEPGAALQHKAIAENKAVRYYPTLTYLSSKPPEYLLYDHTDREQLTSHLFSEIKTAHDSAATGRVPNIPDDEYPGSKRNSSEFFLSNNLLYDLVLTPNIGFEYRLKEIIGFAVNGAWGHLNWGDGAKTYRLWAVYPEVRVYPDKKRRLYAGAMFHIGAVNLKLKETGQQGNIIGGSAVVGYRLPLNRWLLLDFGIGFGYTRFTYDTYNYIDGVNYLKDSGVKNLWLPTKAAVSLTWQIK